MIGKAGIGTVRRPQIPKRQGGRGITFRGSSSELLRALDLLGYLSVPGRSGRTVSPRSGERWRPDPEDLGVMNNHEDFGRCVL